MTCGIYTVTCTKNHTVYVGQSINIRSRWRDHRKKLKAGTHYNKFMQSSFNKYGADNFEYAIHLECSVADLSGNEQQVADALRATGTRLFNTGAYLPVPSRGSKRPDNTARLNAIHADPVRKAHLLRGILARGARMKGTAEAVAAATKASHSRTRKHPSELKTKPRYLCLRKGTPEHSAMRAQMVLAQYASGTRRHSVGSSKPVVRLDTGDVFPSIKALADVLGVSKSAVVFQLKHGSGFCRGVPVAYKNLSGVKS